LKGKLPPFHGFELMSLIRTAMDGASADDFAGSQPRVDSSKVALAELFAPLDHLLLSGGDARIAVDPRSGLNGYGSQAFASDAAAGFSSSTAAPISQRACDRAGAARDALMQAAISDGLEQAFDARMEAMREALRAHLGLRQSGVEVVFSASGTDSQLQALFLARALLGPDLVSIAAADQTGNSTALTSRGLHFGETTANGSKVRKGEAVCSRAGAVSSVGLPLRGAHGEPGSTAECDRRVADAVERAIAAGSNVMLQVMDCSKLGWRVPSDRCIADLMGRWPERLRVVVDACQMRSPRRRIAACLERGYLVLVTGSKYFGGPAFSGALLLPPAIAKAIDSTAPTLPQLADYCARSDWPLRWPALRAQFPSRPNFGAWLRWEAALEEMRAYYAIPESFRRTALATLGQGIVKLIAASPSLRLLPHQQGQIDPLIDHDELLLPTIFAFTVEPSGSALSLDRARVLQRALADGIRNSLTGDAPEDAAQSYLIGQPVGWQLPDGREAAALRLSIGARHVTECWSANVDKSRHNLQRVIDRAAFVIEKLNAHLHDSRLQELSHAD
jgi:hypothetical protein